MVPWILAHVAPGLRDLSVKLATAIGTFLSVTTQGSWEKQGQGVSLLFRPNRNGLWSPSCIPSVSGEAAWEVHTNGCCLGAATRWEVWKCKVFGSLRDGQEAEAAGPAPLLESGCTLELWV